MDSSNLRRKSSRLSRESEQEQPPHSNTTPQNPVFKTPSLTPLSQKRRSLRLSSQTPEEVTATSSTSTDFTRSVRARSRTPIAKGARANSIRPSPRTSKEAKKSSAFTPPCPQSVADGVSQPRVTRSRACSVAKNSLMVPAETLISPVSTPPSTSSVADGISEPRVTRSRDFSVSRNSSTLDEMSGSSNFSSPSTGTAQRAREKKQPRRSLVNYSNSSLSSEAADESISSASSYSPPRYLHLKQPTVNGPKKPRVRRTEATLLLLDSEAAAEKNKSSRQNGSNLRISQEPSNARHNVPDIEIIELPPKPKRDSSVSLFSPELMNQQPNVNPRRLRETSQEPPDEPIEVRVQQSKDNVSKGVRSSISNSKRPARQAITASKRKVPSMTSDSGKPNSSPITSLSSASPPVNDPKRVSKSPAVSNTAHRQPSMESPKKCLVKARNSQPPTKRSRKEASKLSKSPRKPDSDTTCDFIPTEPPIVSSGKRSKITVKRSLSEESRKSDDRRHSLNNASSSSKITTDKKDSPVKRKRGRPSINKSPFNRGVIVKVEVESPSSSVPKDLPTPLNSVKRSRGRPPRDPLATPKAIPSRNPKTPIIHGGKSSPMKTRALQKRVERGEQSCILCGLSKGDMKQCATCKVHYHLRKCLLYSPSTSHNIESREDWCCPRCIHCVSCGDFIDDPNNVECSQCAHAWHGRCKPASVRGIDPKLWKCKECCGKRRSGQMETIPSPTKTPKRVQISAEAYDSDDSTDVDDEFVPPTEQLDPESADLLQRRIALFNELKESLIGRKPPPSSLRSPPKRRFSRSPEKVYPSHSKRIALPEDKDLFESALREFEDEKKAEANATMKKESSKEGETPQNSITNEQWVYMGERPKMKAVNESPYDEDIRSSPNLFVCQFCLRAIGDQTRWRIHVANCTWHHPPGNEIYRDDNISFFEVDGADEVMYCRNLCLLAKLFLSSKILHHEVQTFWFYVLTENTKYGCEIIGYFSKEKNPSKDNNLSCLLTLPNAQKSGYGRLLIDMSYELSRLERKIGGPEHPLSDLGLIAYQGYWRASIVAYLRSMRNAHALSLVDMSLATRISRNDIVNQLLRDRLLSYKDGTYYIKSGTRALKFPLSASRRRTVDREKLIWEPEHDANALDERKLNGYVGPP